MKNKINVILFIDVFGNGGIEKFVFSLCDNIDRTKYSVRIVTINKVTDVYDIALKKLDIDIIPLVTEQIANPIQRFKQGLPLFNSFLNNNYADIIHFNLSDSIDLLYVKSAKNHGVKVRIVHSHNSKVNSSLKMVAHKIGMIFLKNTPNYFWACSHEAAKWLFPSKIYKLGDYKLIHNAIELDKFIFSDNIRNNVRNDNNWEDKLVIGHVGRFNAQKNHKFLIDIFEMIFQQNKNSLLVLVGIGQLQEDMKKYVDEKGLENHVVFYGESDKVNEMMQGFDLFLLPSLYEGLPFVLVESQAAALPALVSDVITKDVNITDYINYFSLDNTPKEWADEVLRLYFSFAERKSPLKELKNAGFDCKEMGKSVSRLYMEAYNEQNEK